MTERNTPLVDAVREARSQNRHPLLVPGHKMQYDQDPATIGYDLLHDLVRDDVGMQGGADSTAYTGGFLDAAEQLYATSSVPITHGSSSVDPHKAISPGC